MKPENLGVLFVGCVAMAGGGISLSVKQCTREHVQTVERNATCAERSGGRLLFGQDGSHVCVDPRGVKWEKKP